MDSKSDIDEFDMAMKPKLPVAQFNEYDPNTPPQSGAEYLRRVQLEAGKEPNIKVATNLKINNSKHLPKQKTDLVYNDNEFIKCNSELRLSDETITLILESFNRLRSHIDQIRIKYGEDEIPYQKRTKKWWKDYCLHKSTECNVKYVDYKLQYCYDTNLPRLALICQLRQTEIIRLLGYHLEWIGEEQEDGQNHFTAGNGLWIYALLAGLDSIQPGDIYSLLRQICRVCSYIRHRMEPDFIENKHLNTLASLNMIIVLVGNYFGQKDLLDSYNE